MLEEHMASTGGAMSNIAGASAEAGRGQQQRKKRIDIAAVPQIDVVTDAKSRLGKISVN